MNDLFNNQTQLDRIEAKLDLLLAPKKKPKPKSSKSEYPDWFEFMWKVYPKRAGNNPKGKAMSACSARFKEDKSLCDSDLSYAVDKYAKFCDATGKTGTELVMHAATFFGPDKHYENSWEIPNGNKQNNGSGQRKTETPTDRNLAIIRKRNEQRWQDDNAIDGEVVG